ncbi:glycosyltransferase family 2 protein [Parasediminibacterium paludis]|uniref:Glycosyltransferase family 2 protein n=1 Tax=Parasediminibacterium paludis TaxID=908966 RepID=A0ABV8PYC7_9BACT
MSQNINKLISIITVVYNGENEIEKTIQSVIKNTSSEVEYIIIDGLSTDNTCKIISSYSHKIDFFISERDNGIYDAMNKGIAHANGKWVLFLNAGDILYQIPFKEIIHKQHADLICFPVLIDNKFKKKPMFNWLIRLNNTLPHQGCFYKKCQFLTYNLKYKIFSDYHLNIQFYKQNKNVICFFDPVVAIHFTNGVSNNKINKKELRLLVLNEFGLIYSLLSRIFFKMRAVYYLTSKK